MRKLRFLVTLIIIIAFFQAKSQTYCTPTYGGSLSTSNFYNQILSLSFGELNVTYSAPYSMTGPIYYDYTYLSTDVVANHAYPLWLIVGNGGNTQTIAVWIDFNHNGIFESSERVLVQTDYANVGDHNIRKTISIPANAYIGQTRLRVGTILGTTAPDPCTNNADPNQQFLDYTININKPAAQVYISSTTYQNDLDEVTKSSADNNILQINVVTNTNGTLSPLNLDTFYMSILGTTNPADISNAKLFFTGKDPEFSTATQAGSTVNNPSTYFTIKANTTLEPGTNYFWLTYSISPNAIIGNALDARCNGIYIRTKRIPSIIDPSGTRNVGYCVSKGNKSQFVYINRVQMGYIDNTLYGTYYNSTGYSNYTYLADTIRKNKYRTLAVTTGNGVNTDKTRAWIDFNGDGVFDNTNELVLFDSISTASTTTPNYGPVVDSFLVPFNAPCGETRLRISSFYNPNVPPYRANATPCDNPLEVGEVEDYKVVIADNGQPVSNFTSSIACLGSPTKFTDQSYTFGSYKINSWLWNFGDGDTSHLKNPSHVYNSSGVFVVTLTTNSNYSGSIPSVLKKAVKVNNPQANFSISGTLYNSNIMFVDETSGGLTNAWYWNFGDPSSGYNNLSNTKTPYHIFDTVGKYKIMFAVTTEGGCMDTIYKTIVIDSINVPVADFTAATFNPYYDQNFQLIDASLNSPVSWKWKITPSGTTFHNSTSSTSKNPVISFNSIDSFFVKLIVSNSKGSDSITKKFISKNYSKPVVDFSANLTSVRAGQIVSFLDQSTNDPTSWIWSFGDGDTSNLQYAAHIYTNIGNYTVSLTAKNPAGTGSKLKPNYIQVTNEYQVCDNDAPSSALFSGLLFDSGGKNGDYNNNSECGFLIQPPCSGPITLSFTMFDYDLSDLLRVYDGVDNTGIPLFSGNGYTGTVTPPKLTANSGAMYIEEITDASITAPGFAAVWNAVPNIKPIAGFDIDSVGYLNGPIIFKNTTMLGTGNIYYWDYNNDHIYEDTNVLNGSHTYRKLGYDTITLLAVNCKGSSLVKHVIHIKNPTSPPVADFTSDLDTALELQPVSFYDMSTMGPTQWYWQVNPPCPDNCYFSNGTSDTSQNPVIQFFDVGPYDISLTATNFIGSSAVTTKVSYIYIKTKAAMCTWPFEINLPAGKIFDSGDENGDYGNNENCFLLLDPCADKVYLSFKMFDFAPGDSLKVYDGKDNTGKLLGGFSGTTVPTSTLLANSGSMYIQEITNSYLTAPGFEADYWIKPIALAKTSFTSPDTAYTGGYVTYFDNTSTGKIDTCFWDYNFDGIYDDTTYNGHYLFTTKGYHYVQLTTSNCSGISRFTKMLWVDNPSVKPVADFEADLTRADLSDVVTLKDLSKNGPNKWTWHFNPSTVTYVNGTDSTSSRPQVRFSAPGYFNVSLIASNGFGSDTLIKKSYIYIFIYCIPTVNTLISGLGISQFVLNEIINSSACGTTAYTDYSQTYIANLELGGTYNFQVSSIRPNAYSRKIWIDYNQDGVFNDTTELAAYDLNNSNLTWADTFKVPSSALLGVTRMRIGVNVAGYSNKPCGPNNFGEYEDYKVNISKDVTPPVITLKGYNPAMTEITYPYIDSGAVAYDAVDGNLTSKITVSSNVNINKVGVYTVKYDVSDNAGNKADEVTRTVYVTPDKTPPVITLKGSNPMSIEVYYPYKEPGATAMDNKDGNVSGNIVIAGTVDTSRVDSYFIYYSAYDLSGNFSNQVTRKVLVIDTIPPVIHLIGQDTVDIPLYGSYVDTGAYVTDNYYTGSENILTVYNHYNVNKEGWWWVRFNAVDGSGNHAITVYRTLKVGNPQGIADNRLTDIIEVYPNPARNIINVSYGLTGRKFVNLEIINQMGQIVRKYDFGNIQNKDIQINLGNEPEGIYFLKSVIGNNVYISRVSVVR